MEPPLLIQGIPLDQFATQADLWKFVGWAPGPPIEWWVEICGTMARIYRENVKLPPPPTRKGKAMGPWTIGSRMRMLRFLNRIDYQKLGPSVFVTLTYPDGIDRKEYRQRSIDRAVMLRAIEKKVGRKVACIWRIEWEERKSGQYTGKLYPHFHLMLINVSFLDWQWVRETWRQAIKAQPGSLVTDVRKISNVNGVCRYLSKYVSKYRSLDIVTYHNSGIQFGRVWGTCRKELIPMCPVRLQRQLDRDERELLCELRKATHKRYGEHGDTGFTVFGDRQVEAMRKFLDRS